jgi:MerR family mercuric resistance operon transcriptional regulator
MFTIGKLADRTGVNIETIRYYERIRLLPPAPRSEGRQRVYSDAEVRRLSFIRRSRELGFSLDDVRALLDIAECASPGCSATKDITLHHLSNIRGKIASLKKLERALKPLTEACQPGTQSSCPIIEALNANT